MLLLNLVHKAAHTNIHYHPQRQEHEQHGRPTVTHQRQGYSSDRHKANHHADIDQDMEAKHSHHTHHHKRASAVGRCLRVLVKRISTMKYNSRTPSAPTNPCSSAKAAKMKSVCGTGRKLPWVCEPLPPQRPPEPTAILDCSTWYPEP